LWPLYFAVLALEAVLVFGLGAYSAENQALFAEKLPCYVLYCSNWLETSGEGPFFVSWSLAVEEQFYLAVALLMLISPGRKALAAVFAVLLLAKVFLVHGSPGVDLSVLPGRVILSYSEAILLGSLLACFLDSPWGYRIFMQRTAHALAAPLVFLVFIVCLAVMDLGDKSGIPALMFYFICALVVGVAATGKSFPVLDGPVLSRIGLYSYGIYLMHMPVLSAMKRLFDSPAWVFLSTFAVVMPIAWFSYHFFEAPIRRFGRLGALQQPTRAPGAGDQRDGSSTAADEEQRIVRPA
jgi:peptidoglycan/LPS O-acetylase OafA/YrhL